MERGMDRVSEGEETERGRVSGWGGGAGEREQGRGSEGEERGRGKRERPSQ